MSQCFACGEEVGVLDTAIAYGERIAHRRCISSLAPDPAQYDAPIMLWRAFESAPPHLQKLSTGHWGGDWLAYVPKSIEEKRPELVRSVKALSRRQEPERHVLENGDVVYIGAFE